MSNRGSARLALADGSIWRGDSFGAEGTTVGEVVFNTSMTGYQEILTDPSYRSQIVLMTAPHIGNTGVNVDDDEAARIHLSGFLVREISPTVSNWRSDSSLSDWLRSHDRIGISGLDTRALTRRLRTHGSVKGAISTDASLSDLDLVQRAQEWWGTDGLDLVRTVTCTQAYPWSEPVAAQWQARKPAQPTDPLRVVVYDFGVKRNILRYLASLGCRVTVVPAHTSAAEALAMDPHGVLLSNGPGDPSALGYAVETTRSLLGRVPILGICLGHQILGQALGGRTYRLKFGHHGGNQPVLHKGRVEISAHNHNFAVEAASLPAEVEITHVNLNDGCCEGFRHRSLDVLSVQYHPEAAPGPHDADDLFGAFINLMRERMFSISLVG